MGAKNSAETIRLQCCHPEGVTTESLNEVHPMYDEYYQDAMVAIRELTPTGMTDQDIANWRCCRSDDLPNDSVVPSVGLESLSYEPVRFDISPTMDEERSQKRYSNIVMHSTRARTQRRSQAWDTWLRGATSGRPITLLSNFEHAEKGLDDEGNAKACLRTPAKYRLDSTLVKLTITDIGGPEPRDEPINIPIDNIQVICPATEFMLFFDQVEGQLDQGEKQRAVLLQYQLSDSPRARLCFLEESELAKDKFVQALTALWLEKRSDNSMWF